MRLKGAEGAHPALPCMPASPASSPQMPSVWRSGRAGIVPNVIDRYCAALVVSVEYYPALCGRCQWSQLEVLGFRYAPKTPNQVVVGWVALAAWGRLGTLVLGPVSPESWVPALPCLWVICRLGSFAQNPGLRVERDRVPWGALGTVCILLWGIMISSSSPSLPMAYRYSYCDSTWD